MSLGKTAEKTKDEGIGMTRLLNGVPNIDFLFMRKPLSWSSLCKDSDLPVLNFSATIPILLGMGLQETLDKKSWIELCLGSYW